MPLSATQTVIVRLDDLRNIQIRKHFRESLRLGCPDVFFSELESTKGRASQTKAPKNRSWMVQSDFVQKRSIKLYTQANRNDARIFQNDLPSEGCSGGLGFACFLLEREAASSRQQVLVI